MARIFIFPTNGVARDIDVAGRIRGRRHQDAVERALRRLGRVRGCSRSNGELTVRMFTEAPRAVIQAACRAVRF